jgi:hypothetical protein
MSFKSSSCFGFEHLTAKMRRALRTLQRSSFLLIANPTIGMGIRIAIAIGIEKQITIDRRLRLSPPWKAKPQLPSTWLRFAQL